MVELACGHSIGGRPAHCGGGNPAHIARGATASGEESREGGGRSSGRRRRGGGVEEAKDSHEMASPPPTQAMYADGGAYTASWAVPPLARPPSPQTAGYPHGGVVLPPGVTVPPPLGVGTPRIHTAPLGSSRRGPGLCVAPITTAATAYGADPRRISPCVNSFALCLHPPIALV